MENSIYSQFEDGNFRSPSGAVPTNSDVIFEIEIPRSFGLKEVFLVWIHDENSKYEYMKMNWKGMSEGRDIYELKVEVQKPGLNWYYFQLKTMTDEFFVGKKGMDFTISDKEPGSWLLTVYDQQFTTPDWIKGGVFYHIFVDRFATTGFTEVKKNVVLRHDWGGLPTFSPNEYGEVTNNDFFGGNLKGIIHKLDYLQSLGVTCLYLSPIFEAHSNHKYDTGDFTKIDPMFGTLEDFHDLCLEAENRGMKILLDGVFNHTGSDSVYFNKKGNYKELGAYQSRESKYFSWYSFSAYPDQYESWWGIDTLPAVNEDEPSYIDFITGDTGIARTWIQEGATGWRLDVVDELPNHFVEKLRNSVKAVDPNALLIGEVWEDASYKIAYGKRKHYFLGSQLDSVMNYPFMNAIITFIRDGNAEYLHEVVTSILQHYPICVVHCLMNMLGTHDTKRILTALGDKELHEASKEEKAQTCMTVEERTEAIPLLKLASLIQMTLPGVPSIYYGDEAGMEGYEDPFNRRCYPWGNEEKELLAWYQKLGSLRKNWNVFKDGEYQTIYAKDGVFIFQRMNECEKVVVGVNRSKRSFLIEVEEPFEDLLLGRIVKNEYILHPNQGCFLGRGYRLNELHGSISQVVK